MELSSEDLLWVNQQLLALYRVRSPNKQTKAILALANQLAPSFVSSVTRFNVRSRRLEVTTRPWIPVPSRALSKIGELAHESPFPAYFAASGDRSWRTLTDFMPPEEFQQTKLFRAMFAPIQCTHIISTMLASIEHDQVSLTLCRRSPAYTERERALLNLIHPHLSLSYNNAEYLERATQTGRELRAVVESAPLGYAYLAGDGQITWATTQARELWRLFYPNEATNEAGVPTPVLGWLRNSLARAAADKLPPMDDALTALGSNAKLETRLLPSSLGGFILAVEERPLSPQPRSRPLPQLSERENEVLQWMVEGKRNAEIASILVISERTVEKHVAQILVKLSVENRATAIVTAMKLCAESQSLLHSSGAGI
jgi:DNA-binding CsgD family transcriptional regulator